MKKKPRPKTPLDALSPEDQAAADNVKALIEMCRSAGSGTPDLEKISTWINNLTAALETAAKVVDEGAKVVHVPGADGLLICPTSTAVRSFGEGFRQGVGALLLTILEGNTQGLELAETGLPITVEPTSEEWIEAEQQAELLQRPAAGETC